MSDEGKFPKSHMEPTDGPPGSDGRKQAVQPVRTPPTVHSPNESKEPEPEEADGKGLGDEILDNNDEPTGV